MSFHLETDDKSFAGSSLILDTIREIQAAFAMEKKQHGLTQQSVAEKLGLKHRSIVSRWLRGNENLSLRTIGELAWALNKRAVIKFEDSVCVGGNFFDVEPLPRKSADTIKAPDVYVVTPNSSSADAWGSQRNIIQKSATVLENA
ncbi:helix-turn-helix domain-containing protein [Methylorubrum extorquens]|uniref:helix-turn-helix domain-containing protein n=1 Tax=Methylorubrum extorquens TaxID=408 RepID=UPI00209FF168|nr:helix-turn-helix transcriptional regulator [Methylorubrum extorquens]MCP1537785.1 transcriptional regulator with XRE-family HTH domain [Methylorubrum extorquens]